jgi:hypothetical protein
MGFGTKVYHLATLAGRSQKAERWQPAFDRGVGLKTRNKKNEN